jgi:8-oxo-dGTP diphosphatase
MQHVAVGIIVENGQVLVCQRKRNARYPLKWEFPGGKIEANEAPENALERELREELSINAAIGKEFHRQEWTYTEGFSNSTDDGTFKVVYYLIDSFKGKPANRAFEQIQWVTPSELQKMDILDGNKEAVNLLVKHAKKESA